jgi:hypothetical protein
MLKEKTGHIITELRAHAPFTLFGAFTGIVLMLVFKNISESMSFRLFYVFHPGHVILSAIVTASMFELHSKKVSFPLVMLVGITGSVGIATVSDSLIPYAGEALLGMHVHAHAHEGEGFAHSAHIGFIEGWYIVLPAAILGVLIAYFRPKTKFPHAGHVLLSTWASSLHILMAAKGNISLTTALVMLVFLFIAVWLPCCISDIVFPLLFVKGGTNHENVSS